MKNLFFILAFLLFGTFSFASIDEIERPEVIEQTTIETNNLEENYSFLILNSFDSNDNHTCEDVRDAAFDMLEEAGGYSSNEIITISNAIRAICYALN